jgi:hypothetical protein
MGYFDMGEMKKEVIAAIKFAVLLGGSYLIWTKIDGLVLKIILSILLILVILSIKNNNKNYRVPDGSCPFLNDIRLLAQHGNINPDIFYSTYFCSVSDYGGLYESVNWVTRPVSNTNKYSSCCTNGGETVLFLKNSII